MRKFTIISRKGVTTIQEVEIELVSTLEDPSVMWMKPGEYKAKVLKPESLYEKQNDGRLISPIWCWFAFFNSEDDARAQAEQDLKREMERAARKNKSQFNAIECLARVKEIQVITL
jgi:hypothetical protein